MHIPARKNVVQICHATSVRITMDYVIKHVGLLRNDVHAYDQPTALTPLVLVRLAGAASASEDVTLSEFPRSVIR